MKTMKKIQKENTLNLNLYMFKLLFFNLYYIIL